MTDNSVEIKEYEQVVECIVGSETYALPISWVEEIIQPQPVTPIPRAHPAILGLTLVRGKVLPVIDLATVLEGEDRDGKDSRFIVLKIQEEELIFNVHAVNGIQQADKIEEPTDLYRERSYVHGVIPKGDRILLVIDFLKLLDDIRQG